MDKGLRQLIEIYLSRFCNRTDVYAKQFVKGDDFQYFPVRARMTPEIMYACLCGFWGMGFYALNQDGLGKWICFDSDTINGALDKLENWLQQHGWHCLREGKRPGRDGHLWLVFTEPISGERLRVLAQAMLKSAGIAHVKIEVFPKQDRPVKVGSLVRAPLSHHFKPSAHGAIGWFEDCPEKTIKAQLEWLAQRPLNSAAAAIKLADAHRPMPKPIYLKPKPVNLKKPRHDSKDSEDIDFVKYATENNFEKRGEKNHVEYIGPCPSCKFEGHDSDDNHLNIDKENNLVHCWRRCGFLDIVRAMRFTKILDTAS